MRRLLSPRRFCHPARGLTLVELSISMFINLLGAVAIISILLVASKMAAQSYYMNKATMEARLVVDHLTSDARMAVSLEESFGSYTADANTLILRLPSIDADGMPIDPEAVFDRIVYHRAPSTTDKLARTVIADPSSARTSESRVIGESLTPGIFAVQPDPIGEFVIYYRFDSIQQWAGKTTEVPIAGSIQLRNHQ